MTHTYCSDVLENPDEFGCDGNEKAVPPPIAPDDPAPHGQLAQVSKNVPQKARSRRANFCFPIVGAQASSSASSSSSSSFQPHVVKGAIRVWQTRLKLLSRARSVRRKWYDSVKFGRIHPDGTILTYRGSIALAYLQYKI